MNNDINQKLPYQNIIKNTYRTFYTNIKQYLIISYLLMLPVFLMSLLLPITIEPQSSLSGTMIIYLLLVMFLIIVFTIFLLRLYTLGGQNLYKIKPANFLIIFGKTLFYYITLYTVFILAILSVGLLFGLVVSVINSVAGETALNASMVSNIVLLFMSLFLMLIALRVMPTFISIAISDNFLPMKSAYYYTRDNNKRLIWIGMICALPAFLIVNQFSILFTQIDPVILYVLSPMSLIPYALLLAVGAEIYKYLFGGADIIND